MALNYSHHPTLPAHNISEDNLFSPMRFVNGCLVEGISERNGDGFVKQWPSSDYGGNNMDRGGLQESGVEDILDMLPADPFGMDPVTAIKEFFEHLKADYGGRSEVSVVGKGDYSVFAGFNFVLNAAMSFQTPPCNLKVDDKMVVDDSVEGCFIEEELRYPYCDGDVHPACIPESVRSGIASVCIDEENEDFQKEATEEVTADLDHEVPRVALGLAIGYLGVRELLSLERVCKSWRSAVRDEPFPWQSIHIDQTLNERVTDDVLMQLTSRAQGKLQCLSLVECQRITDDGLRRVLESNPMLTKLSVPGCTRLSIDGVISCLRDFKMVAVTGVKYLRIGGLYGVTQKHFEELISILGIHNHVQANHLKPHFYHRGNFYLPYEDDRPIDIEMCPRCQNLRLVYDCPSKSCQGNDRVAQLCRACTLCIPRCVQCGKCINDGEYEETFFLELLCLYCWKQQPKCQEKHDVRHGPPKHSVGQEPGLSFYG